MVENRIDRMSGKNLKIAILGFLGSEKVRKNQFLGFFAATFFKKHFYVPNHSIGENTLTKVKKIFFSRQISQNWDFWAFCVPKNLKKLIFDFFFKKYFFEFFFVPNHSIRENKVKKKSISTKKNIFSGHILTLSHFRARKSTFSICCIIV